MLLSHRPGRGTAVTVGMFRQVVAAGDGPNQPEAPGPGDTGFWIGLGLVGLGVGLRLTGAELGLTGIRVRLGVGRQLARAGPGLYPGNP